MFGESASLYVWEREGRGEWEKERGGEEREMRCGEGGRGERDEADR